MTQILTNARESRRTAVAVNVAKIALLAALAPPVIAGIAQRASSLVEGADIAAMVSYTVSLGSISAVVGALGLGALSDLRQGSITAKWLWTLLGIAVGTAGLILLALGNSEVTLVAGWVLAQSGYSGAMAVLRAILASTLPAHRRRGAVVVVLGGYGGLFLPVAILLFLPGSVWVTTFILAIASLLIPAVVLFGHSRSTSLSMTQNSAHREDSGSAPEQPAFERTADVSGPPLPRGCLLLVQCAANLVVTVFLAYHPLDLAARAADTADFPVRTSVWIVAAALMGLAASTSTLLWKPMLLANSVKIVAFAGFGLAVSLILRATTDSLLLMVLAAVLGGAAVGLNSSALFSAALDAARSRSGGKLMGLYSAAGALGQFAGPMIALAMLRATAEMSLVAFDPVGYRTLFLLLAFVPLSWGIGFALLSSRATQRPDHTAVPHTVDAATRTPT